MRKRRAALLLSVLLWPCGVHAQAKWNPDLIWRTTETEHFAIHFDSTLEPLIPRVAEVAEEVHRELSPRIGWLPRTKTHLVMANRSDDVQGLATPAPYNLIVLNAAPPLTEEMMLDFTDWFRDLIGHEYTHILHTDKVSGVGKGLRAVFGGAWVPNGLAPQWVTEGYATLEESTLTSGGRTHSAYTDMVVRTAVLYGRFPSLDQVNGGLLEGMGGNAAYLFGARFQEYLRNQYGAEGFKVFTDSQGGRIVPYFTVGLSGQAAYGKSLKALWSEWKERTHAEVDEWREARRREGLVEGEAVVKGREPVLRMAHEAVADRLLFWTRSLDRSPRLVEWSLEERDIVSDFTATALTLHPLKPLAVYAASASVGPFETMSDLFQVDVESGSTRRLSRGKRLLFPAFDPTGEILVAVQFEGSRHRLVNFRPSDKNVQPLDAQPSAKHLGALAVSPDNRTLAVSVWREKRGTEGSWDILLLDRQGGFLQAITDDRAVDYNPSFSSDGEWVLFDSDRSGAFNVLSWNRTTGEIRQATNVETGAFQPVVSGDKVYYRRYQPEGFDVYAATWDPASWPVVQSPHPSHLPPAGEGGDTERSDGDREQNHRQAPVSRPYSAFPDLLIPRLWSPIFFFNDRGVAQYGVATFNLDPLFQHVWYVEADYRPDAATSEGEAFYQNDTQFPSIFVSGRRRVFSVGPLDSDFYQRSNRAEAGMSFPDVKYGALASYTLEDRMNFGSDADPELLFPGRFAGVRTGLGYDSTKAHRYSISPEKGIRFSSSWEILHNLFGSEFDQQVLRGDARWYRRVPLLPRHAVALRGAAGAAVGEATRGAFALGGFVGESPIVLVPERTFMLRGYDFNAYRGRRFVLGSAEYRFPLAKVERGVGIYPLFLQQVHGLMFADVGQAWNRAFDAPRTGVGVGGEIVFNSVLFYGLPADIHLGVGRGLTDQGATTVIFRIGPSF